MEFILIFIGLIIIIAFIFGKNPKTQKAYPTKIISTNESEIETEWNKWKNSFELENSTEIFKTFNTKVVGVSYKNKDGSDRQSIISKCRNNEKLLLIPELFKKPDIYAIMVCRENFEQIGFLNSILAEEIADLMIRRKSRVDAIISNITGENENTKGINIEITKYLVKKRQQREKTEPIKEKAYDSNIKMHRLSYQRNIQASELERDGYIENAIELYKSIVDNKKLEMNDASMPFSRLAIIYRKRKEYKNEIDIIKKWITMFENSSMNEIRKKEEIDKLSERLEKAIKLNENSGK